MKSTNLTEQTIERAFNEAAVDRAAGMIEGASLLGRTSRNGRFYSDGAMRSAVPLYDGVGVYIDHPESKSTKVRSLRDLAGRVRNPRLVDDRIKGDVQLLSTAPGQLVAEIAERMPSAAGLSHRASGKVATNADGRQLVKEITSVKSVDLVTEPATTEGLLESVQARSEERDPLAEMHARVTGQAAPLDPETLAAMEETRRGDDGADLDRILEQEL